MQKHIQIQSIQKEAEQIILVAESSIENKNELKATGHMLVDSDSLAFIYKLETETEFVYVNLPHTMWDVLKEVKDHRPEVFLQVEDKEILLEDIAEELDYLIDNIEGNANYGDEMVNTVEEYFFQR
ncbi:hypothetical protein LCL95_08630 [Bacillus timonensis]|nr:hypothetical protein [Bacillus timonensis]